MNLKHLLFTAAAAVVLTLFVGRLSQGQYEGIKITLDEEVIVGDKVLEPGEYEVRRASTTNEQLLQIFNRDKLKFETTALTVPELSGKVPERSTVIVEHIGDKAYLDTIWMAGKSYGFHFPLPEQAERLKRELALNESAPAKAEDSSNRQLEKPQPVDSDAAAVAEQSEEAVVAEAEAESESQSDVAAREFGTDQQRKVDIAKDRGEVPKSEAQPEPQLDRDEDRIQIAQLQQNERNVPPGNTAARPAPANVQDNAAPRDPEQLPATADNWAGFVLGGFLLLTLSAWLRRAEGED